MARLLVSAPNDISGSLCTEIRPLAGQIRVVSDLNLTPKGLRLFGAWAVRVAEFLECAADESAREQD